MYMYSNYLTIKLFKYMLCDFLWIHSFAWRTLPLILCGSAALDQPAHLIWSGSPLMDFRFIRSFLTRNTRKLPVPHRHFLDRQIQICFCLAIFTCLFISVISALFLKNSSAIGSLVWKPQNRQKQTVAVQAFGLPF